MADSKNIPADEQDELFWTAFQYVAGELGHDDIADFEARLEHDQAAREAVAAAVELSLAAAAAEELLCSPRAAIAPAARDWSSADHWRVSTTWLALAAAACVLMAAAIFWAGLGSATGPPASTDGAENSDDARLADAWAERAWRKGEQSDDFGASADWADEENAEELMPDDFVEGLFTSEQAQGFADAGLEWEPADELIISDWLLDAISAERDAPNAGHREG